MNTTFYYGERSGDQTAIKIRLEPRSKIQWVEIPKTSDKVVDLPTALAYILGHNFNLCRTRNNLKCTVHNRRHHYWFSQCMGVGFLRVYGMDTIEEVVAFARSIK